MKIYEVTIQYDREDIATYLFFLKKVYGKKNCYHVKTYWANCMRWIQDRSAYMGHSHYEVIRLWIDDHDEIANGAILKFDEVKI